MIKNVVYVFDGSFFGFLTVIFECFQNKTFDCKIIENNNVQESFYFQNINVLTDEIKAQRVIKGIKNKISEKAFENVYFAFLSFEKSRFTDILKYLELGFKVGGKIDDYKIYDFVINVLKECRGVEHEAHMLSGFARFAETKENVLYSEISPDNDVIELLANHFSDRLPDEKWLIYDTKRKKCAAFKDGRFLILDNVDNLNISVSDNEALWQKLWKDFFETIAVDSRKNAKRQTQTLPKKFRKNMIEFLN